MAGNTSNRPSIYSWIFFLAALSGFIRVISPFIAEGWEKFETWLIRSDVDNYKEYKLSKEERGRLSALTNKTHKSTSDWLMLFRHAPQDDYRNFQQWRDYRIQIAYIDPKGSDKLHYSIVSMKLDGSDIRRAAGAELINQIKKRGTTLEGMQRSPNNEYLAISYGSKSDISLAVIDLHKKRV